MGEPVTAYIHKGCKTCKRSMDYMEAHGIAYQPVELFDETPTVEELRTLLRQLSLTARELLRPRDRMYRELDLKNREIPDEELIQLIAENPGLMKRPILVRGGKATLGIKPEKVEELVR